MRAATVFNFLIEATLMGSVMIVILLLVRKFLRPRLGSRLIWLAWLLVMARLLLPISFPNPMMNELRPTLSDNVGVRPIADQVRVRAIDAAYDLSGMVRVGTYNDPGPAAKALREFGAQTSYGHTARWLLLGYGIAAALVLAGMVWQNARFMRKLKRDRVEALTGEALVQYHALCKQRKVSPVPVYWVDPLPSACLVGVLRPYIALPLTLERQDITPVLLHEICHQKAGDPWRALLRNLCCVVHWFNPLVWVAAHLSRTDQELACDERVTAPMVDEQRIDYANTLALAAARRNAPDMAVLATGMTMKGRHIKQRVRAIVDGRKAVTWLCVAALLVATAGTVVAFATAEYVSPLKMPDVMPMSGTPIEKRSVADEAAALAYGAELLHKAFGTDAATVELAVEQRQDLWRVRAIAERKTVNEHMWYVDFDAEGTVWRLDDTQADWYGPTVPGNPTYKTNAAFSAPYDQYVRSFAALLMPDQSLDGLFIDNDFWCLKNRFLIFSHRVNDNEQICQFVLQIEPEVKVRYFDRFVNARTPVRLDEINAENQRVETMSRNAQGYGAEFQPMSALKEDTELYAQAQHALSSLTEVYGYSYEDASRFVFALAQKDGETYCVYHDPEMPNFDYVCNIKEPTQARTPFQSQQGSHNGEGGFRYFWDMAEENGWLIDWQEPQRAAFLETALNEALCNIPFDTDMQQRILNGQLIPAQAVQAAFEVYYGDPSGWSEPLTAWRDYTLLRFGLAAQPVPAE